MAYDERKGMGTLDTLATVGTYATSTFLFWNAFESFFKGRYAEAAASFGAGLIAPTYLERMSRQIDASMQRAAENRLYDQHVALIEWNRDRLHAASGGTLERIIN